MSGKPHIFQVDRNDDEEKISISETAAEERERENFEDETDHRQHPKDVAKKEDCESDKATVSERGSDAVDDGFKTPTSSDHRIPAITQCPPAPMKPRPPPPRLKRKASSPPPAEIESIFRSIANDQDDAHHHKFKKARTDDQDRSS
ncbi:cyclin-dependent protein kinase inhibitor SMR10 [Salvia miltiorrhiza]|uniref:cyclin-dependent protein kinase inhibitor SMR10 n=1 Tax=Salvia miltiorrhiza TaxID=226208 RepID=UPI0025AC7620|nr:cyclin-dependent protein kinase inhibitor SMR10 [Salvia miltiorrhiza]